MSFREYDPDRDEVRLDLALSDPIECLLDKGAPWRGIGGDYVVTLGPSSNAEPGVDAALPTLTASVGAFTRMRLGVRPATGLAVTDELAGPWQLLTELDCMLRLPEPKQDGTFSQGDPQAICARSCSSTLHEKGRSSVSCKAI